MVERQPCCGSRQEFCATSLLSRPCREKVYPHTDGPYITYSLTQIPNGAMSSIRKSNLHHRARIFFRLPGVEHTPRCASPHPHTALVGQIGVVQYHVQHSASQDRRPWRQSFPTPNPSRLLGPLCAAASSTVCAVLPRRRRV